MACMYLLFGVVVVDNWYLHKIQNRYPQHYPTYHLVYQGSGMAKFEKYSQRGLVFFFPVGTLQVPTYLLFTKIPVFFFPLWEKKKTKPWGSKFQGPIFYTFSLFFPEFACQFGGSTCSLFLAITSSLHVLNPLYC